MPPHFFKTELAIFSVLFTIGCGNVGKQDSGHQTLETEAIFSPRSYDHLGDRTSVKIGFGSCLDQDKSMAILDKVKAAAPDMFLMIGDNVYGDTPSGELSRMESAYAKQKENFAAMSPDFPVEAIWDDHDYGINDGGIDYSHKC